MAFNETPTNKGIAMKKIKIILLIILGYTLGEFFTQWRLQTTPMSLKEYTKYNFSQTKTEWKQATATGEKLVKDPSRGKEMLKDLVFPYRNQN